jgi:DNA-binding IclR family transcriptional regulator
MELIMENETSTSKRVLMVLSAILENGPITVDNLAKTLPITQSGVYRAVRSLEEFGWVQKCIGHGGFIATMIFHEAHDQGQFGVPYVETMRRLLRQSELQKTCHADFYVVQQNGKCILADSTERMAKRFATVSLVRSLAGQSVLAALPTVERVQLIMRYLKSAGQDEKDYVKQANFREILRLDPKWSGLWGDGKNTIALPMTAQERVFGTMMIRPKSGRTLRSATLHRSLPKLILAYEGLDAPEFSFLPAGSAAALAGG